MWTKIAYIEFLILVAFAVFYFAYYRPHHQTFLRQFANKIVILPTTIPPTTIPTPTESIIPTPTTSKKTATPTLSKSNAIQTYFDSKYGFQFQYPGDWNLTKTKNTNFSLEVVKVTSADKKSTFTADVREGIWSNIKLELRNGYKSTTFLGQPALLKGNTYTVKSTVSGEVVQITSVGTAATKIQKTFKFL